MIEPTELPSIAELTAEPSTREKINNTIKII